MQTHKYSFGSWAYVFIIFFLYFTFLLESHSNAGHVVGSEVKKVANSGDGANDDDDDESLADDEWVMTNIIGKRKGKVSMRVRE